MKTVNLGNRKWVRSSLLGLALACAGQSFAGGFGSVDVAKEGKVRFVVVDAKTGKALTNATVTLEDPFQKISDQLLKTNGSGVAESALLHAQQWLVAVDAPGYTEDDRSVTIQSIQEQTVQVGLVKMREIVVRVVASRLLVQANSTSNGVTLPGLKQGGGGNLQSLNNVLRTAPSAAQDSGGQLHVRGEHAATSIYIDGIRLPDALQGTAGSMVSPSEIKSLDFITGGFAPEYGGGMAAVINITLKAGSVHPFSKFYADAGGYNTQDSEFSFGGELGQQYGIPELNNLKARRFQYFFDLTQRQTSNAEEPPQPYDQTAHNGAKSITGFGNMTYQLSHNDKLGMILSESPDHTQLANRTSLPDSFIQYGGGQGFGYLGHLTAAQAAAEGIVSQNAAGQDITQFDNSEFGLVDYRHDFSKQSAFRFAVAVSHEGFEVNNNNPSVNLNNLPADNSIEFNPTVIRNSHSVEIQGTYNRTVGPHDVLAGFGISPQSGNESYQLIPASQLALAGLTSIDPRLAPVNGIPSTLSVVRKGYYDDVFAQDTWRMTRKLTANYGARVDFYHQSETSLVNGTGSQYSEVDRPWVSPRINFSYALTKTTVLRTSYNKIMIIPPISGGAILGQQIVPETLNQYDLSIDSQVGKGQTLSLAAYYKDIRNQVDTGVLIPGSQIGIYTSVNFDKGSVHGLELAYDISPVKDFGWGGYVSAANEIARPGGFDNTGAPVPRFNDHDQLWTVSTGVDYSFKGGGNANLDLNYGSGFASSQILPNGPLTPHTEIDLGLTSPSRWLGGRGTLGLSVVNLFNELNLLNYQSGFSGTRFQQGRRVLLSLNLKF